MAILNEPNRRVIWASLMRLDETYANMLKGDLRAAVDAVDDWIEANQASFNAALPLPARTSLTARQKASLFMAVAAKKFEVT